MEPVEDPNDQTTLNPVKIFLKYVFTKGQYAFYPIKLSHFSEKKTNVCQKYHFNRGDPYKLGQKALDHKIFQKSSNIFEGSRHPKNMNPFEYG